MAICFLTLTIISRAGIYEKELQTERSQHNKVEDLFKKNRKWQIVTVGATERQTTQ
jgi:hypothetical protein